MKYQGFKTEFPFVIERVVKVVPVEDEFAHVETVNVHECGSEEESATEFARLIAADPLDNLRRSVIREEW